MGRSKNSPFFFFFKIPPNVIFSELRVHNEGASKDLKKDGALALAGNQSRNADLERETFLGQAGFVVNSLAAVLSQ